MGLLALLDLLSFFLVGEGGGAKKVGAKRQMGWISKNFMKKLVSKEHFKYKEKDNKHSLSKLCQSIRKIANVSY